MDLTELYGEDFSKRYAEYIKMADAGKIRKFEKLQLASNSAKSLFNFKQPATHGLPGRTLLTFVH